MLAVIEGLAVIEVLYCIAIVVHTYLQMMSQPKTFSIRVRPTQHLHTSQSLIWTMGQVDVTLYFKFPLNFDNRSKYVRFRLRYCSVLLYVLFQNNEVFFNDVRHIPCVHQSAVKTNIFLTITGCFNITVTVAILNFSQNNDQHEHRYEYIT